MTRSLTSDEKDEVCDYVNAIQVIYGKTVWFVALGGTDEDELEIVHGGYMGARDLLLVARSLEGHAALLMAQNGPETPI